MQKIDVLDHGFVRLVDSRGNDLSIVRSARVSYDAQYEIRVYADALKELAKTVVPETIALWEAKNENRN
jgi:thymidylate synthase ThyX